MLRGIPVLKPYANLHLHELDNLKGINEFIGCHGTLNGSNNSGDIIIAVWCIFLRKLIAVHGIIASVVKIIKILIGMGHQGNKIIAVQCILCGGTSRLQNICSASYVVGHHDY